MDTFGSYTLLALILYLIVVLLLLIAALQCARDLWKCWEKKRQRGTARSLCAWWKEQSASTPVDTREMKCTSTPVTRSCSPDSLDFFPDHFPVLPVHLATFTCTGPKPTPKPEMGPAEEVCLDFIQDTLLEWLPGTEEEQVPRDREYWV